TRVLDHPPRVRRSSTHQTIRIGMPDQADEPTRPEYGKLQVSQQNETAGPDQHPPPTGRVAGVRPAYLKSQQSFARRPPEDSLEKGEIADAEEDRDESENEQHRIITKPPLHVRVEKHHQAAKMDD